MNKIITIITLLLFFNFAKAESEKVQAGYEVHYIAFGSLNLSPEVAKNYNIQRSATRGYINISVLKQNKGRVSDSVAASIKLTAKNLYGQNKNIELRKIAENDGAIYYVGTFPVTSRENVNFKALVNPEGSRQQIEIKFSQEFFTD